MMEFNHFNWDVLIFIMFILLVIGIQGIEYYWPSEVGWHPIGRIKYIYIYPIEGGYRKEVEQVDCSKDCGLSFSDKNNHYVWKDRKYLIYTKQRNEPENEPLELSETLEKDQTQKEYENSVGQRPEDEIPKESKEPEPIDLHNPHFITLKPNVLQDVQLREDVRTVKYPDGTITYIRDCGNRMAYNLSKMCGNTRDTLFNRLGSQNKYVRSLLFKSRKPNKIKGEIQNYNYLNPQFSMCSLVNEESVEEIKLMSENDDFSHVNFRSNFVIEASPKYCEDKIESLKIGSVLFKNVLPCAVGEYVNIDPEAGNVYSRNQPYSTLLEKRKLKDVRSDISTVSDIPVFGITFDISTKGKIHIGDQVFAKFRRSQSFLK